MKQLFFLLAITASTAALAQKPLQLTSPGDKTVIHTKELKKPIKFSWTHVDQQLKERIVYTIRIYQLEPGQEIPQALKANQPIWEKEVKTTAAFWQPNKEYAAAKESKTFVWMVQAVNSAGRPVENKGYSKPFTFVLSGETEESRRPDW